MKLLIAKNIFFKNKLVDKKNIGLRKFGGVKFLDAKGTAEETVYFKKEDEALLRNLLQKNPNINPQYDFDETEIGYEELSNDLSLVFTKHGINGFSSNLLKDLVNVFELNGYRKIIDNK